MQQECDDTAEKKKLTPGRIAKGTLSFLRIYAMFWVKLLAGSAVVTAALQALPDEVVSQDLDDYLAENNIDSALAGQLAHKDIHVYQRYNPLVAFHVPGRVIRAVAHEIYDAEYSLAFDFNDNGETGALEKHASMGLVSLFAYPYGLAMGAGSSVLAPFESAVAYSINPGSLNNPCFVFPGGKLEAPGMIKTFTGIPKSYTGAFNVTARDVNEWIIGHEGQHCDTTTGGSTLERETEADYFAARTFRERDGNEDMVNLIKYARAVAALHPDREDIDHATAIGLEALLNGEEMPYSYNIRDGNERLRNLVMAEFEHASSDEVEDFITIYNIVENLLQSGELEDEYSVQAARLYMEGVQFLAPGSVPAPRPSVEPVFAIS